MIKQDLSKKAILGTPCRTIRFEEVQDRNYQLIDVRSTAEFYAGRVPGAVSIPLFDEDERSVIGTIYKHAGRDQAVDQGYEYVEKKLSNLLEQFSSRSDVPLAVYCARGGMRSKSVVNLLHRAGLEAYQLEGGYKRHRRLVLEQLERFSPRLIVIHGLTGTGKTRLLQLLDNAIDLEELARHRSSLFGGLDREPSTQKNFESTLAEIISGPGQQPYFIEGESRKIGRVFIPKPLAMAMKEGTLVYVHCSLETRIARIIEDYPVTDEKRLLELESIIKSMKQSMGSSVVEKMCSLLRNGKLQELTAILLQDYYDKRYSRSMSEYQYALELSSEDLHEAAASLTQFRASHCQPGTGR